MSAIAAPRRLDGRRAGKEFAYCFSFSSVRIMRLRKKNQKSLSILNLSLFVDEDLFFFVCVCIFFFQTAADFSAEINSFVNELIVRGPAEIRELRRHELDLQN